MYMYNYVEAICRHTLVVKQQVQALQEIVTSARTLKFVIMKPIVLKSSRVTENVSTILQKGKRRSTNDKC